MVDLIFLVIFTGCLVTGGIYLVVISLVPATIRLDDALNQLDGNIARERDFRGENLQTSGFLERIGYWCYQKLRLPISEDTIRQLALRGRSVSDFFAEKVVWVFAGFVAPLVYSAILLANGMAPGYIPMGLSLVLAVIGYFLPDFILARSAVVVRQSATEALFMFFDLVVLERLANRSVTQALHSVAEASDVAIFVRIRTALDRARLEQVPPWQELHRLSKELQLPVIADFADVLRLEEQGAALSDPLRARLRELREAALVEAKQEANMKTERMTVWMTLPVLIFGAALLIPPILILMQG
ncbi:MAG: hypothetical protein CR979_01615 [Propionibacterium sp.]|nr:MAG: hypothetical protein CR979_01615 [Propionibacterium sp.]